MAGINKESSLKIPAEVPLIQSFPTPFTYKIIQSFSAQVKGYNK
jgi:hypothetical protein